MSVLLGRGTGAPVVARPYLGVGGQPGQVLVVVGGLVDTGAAALLARAPRKLGIEVERRDAGRSIVGRGPRA